MERYRQMNPDKAKVWTQKSSIHSGDHSHRCDQHELQHNRSVPVIYYLCGDGLDHPHFMEVPLSSSTGLYLKDVIDRLSVLRGRHVASMYSWSCKRIYKNGYVWHDLCDDDLIAPGHGNEYILKGSELFQESNTGRFSPAGTYALPNQKALPEPPSTGNSDEPSSSPSLNGRSTKSSQNDEQSSQLQPPCSLTTWPEYRIGKNSAWNGSSSLIDYNAHKSGRLADASTQTDEKAGIVVPTQDSSTGVVVTDDGTSAPTTSSLQSCVSPIEQSPGICRAIGDSPSSSGQTCTLESLIQADVRKLNRLRLKLNRLRLLEKAESRMPPCTKVKVLNMIMHLISCGSVSVKDHNFGLIPTYKPIFSDSKFGGPLFSTSFILGEADCIDDNPFTKQSDCSGRSTLQLNPTEGEVAKSSTISNIAPSKVKGSPNKHPICKSARSPLSERTRSPSERVEDSQTVIPEQEQSIKPDSLANNDRRVIRIEERLASGARVIIQTKIS